MSFTGLLPHTAEVYRGVGSTDRLGQPADPMQVVAPHHTVVCRLATSKSGGVMDDERTQWVYTVRHILFCDAAVDLAENDVVRVLTGDGRELLAKSRVRVRKDVYSATKLHHCEFDLEVRRGPTDGP